MKMGAVKGRTQAAKTSQYSFGRVPCVIVWKGYAVVTFLCFFSLCEQRKKGISFRYFLWAIKENDKYVLLTLLQSVECTRQES